ncbi:MAG: 30S ribosomal protein S14 [Alphaproteobacteria bacterium GM7ARS4]|nr:30S ribosomal protein S14 [Alphaproteobacteria bacterium GM7ARS4]
MAKKSVVERNSRRQRIIDKYAAKRRDLKARIHDKGLDKDERFHLCLSLSTMPRDSSPVRYRRRCIITGRGRGVYRRFRLSRIMLRDLAGKGEIPGMSRSSW